MVFTILNLGKRQTAWYPTFVTYPMWNYDWYAYETLVCIGMRLFHKLWTTSFHKNQSACMNGLVADLTDNLSRPPTQEGVPYIFSMFSVLLGRKDPAAASRSYVLLEEDGSSQSQAGGAFFMASLAPPEIHPWAFAQKGFLNVWTNCERERRDFLCRQVEGYSDASKVTGPEIAKVLSRPQFPVLISLALGAPIAPT